MKKGLAIAVFILVATFGTVFSARAETDINQQILDLRAKVEALTKLADQYRANVTSKQKEANTLKQQIAILNNQILRLQTQIEISVNNIESSKIEIADLEGKIFDAEKDMDREKGTIGEMMMYVYQQDRASVVAQMLASNKLSDITDQAQQITNLNQRISGMLKELKIKKDFMVGSVANLNQKKAALEELNKKQISQKASLGINKTYKDKLLTDTKGEETKYQQLLTQAEKQQAQFFAELKSIEDQAVSKGAFIVHVTASSVPARGTKPYRYPFDDSYRLTQGYGMTTYAKRGTYGGAPHNGIDIDSGFGSAIHPIGPGAVLASSFNNGFGNWVAVRHANDMVSVYGHMQTPSGLANGTAVDSSSVLGYEGNTGNSTGAHLHLSVYKDFFTYINPKNGQLYFNYFEGSLNPLDYLQK